MKEYYICAPEHTEGWVRTFWREGACGYTVDLDQAGLFEKDYGQYPTINKDNLSDWGKYDDFLIHKDDIELLGKIIRCVFN